MEKINDEMVFFKSLLLMMKNQFGKDTEIVLHDWSRGYDHSIAAIENGEITNRKVNDCGSNMGLEVIRGTATSDMKCNYVTKTRDGKILKSSTMYIKNDKGEPIGALCINSDISETFEMKKFIDSLLPQELSEGSGSEYFASDVSDLLVYLLNQSIILVGKPVSEMTKEDKMKALEYLDEKGALLISKSSVRICKELEMSKYTLYSYLDEIHQRKENLNH